MMTDLITLLYFEIFNLQCFSKFKHHFEASLMHCDCLQILECLYREQWTAMDGLGALIISPTRELAYQTFEVLRKVGKNHEFSAGLVIGGKVCHSCL